MTVVDTFTAVVPAAGIGSRMNSTVAKQYLSIGTQTVIEHTLNGLLSHPQIKRVVVVLHPQDKVFSTLPIAQDLRVQTVIGGAERVDSVLCGLQHCLSASPSNANEWVLVHDAARPCVTQAELDTLLACANHCDGAILAVPVVDTIKRSVGGQIDTDASIEKTIDRSLLWQAQTPQFFPLNKLIDAIELAQHEGLIITDEASAMEHSNAEVKLIEGRSSNIKITRPSDLALAAFYLHNNQSENNNKLGDATCSV